MKLRFEPVRRLCQDAIADEVVPGFVVLVASAPERGTRRWGTHMAGCRSAA